MSTNNINFFLLITYIVVIYWYIFHSNIHYKLSYIKDAWHMNVLCERLMERFNVVKSNISWNKSKIGIYLYGY